MSTSVQIIEFVSPTPTFPAKKQSNFIPDLKHVKEQVQMSVSAQTNPEFVVADKPQEVWPFIESERFEKTFDVVSKLGEGAYGCVFHVKHKLDANSYALKKIKIHMEYREGDSREDRKQALLSNPAMKEIEAISRLNHKNIVGYKGCWVEAQKPDLDRVKRIQEKQQKRKKKQYAFEVDEKICERNDDDSDYERDFFMAQELHHDVEKQAEFQNDFFEMPDKYQSDGDEGSYYDDESEEDYDDSDLDSQSSLY